MHSSGIDVAIKNLAVMAIMFPNQVCNNIIYILTFCACKLYSLGLYNPSDSMGNWECGKLVLPIKSFVLGVKFKNFFVELMQ